MFRRMTWSGIIGAGYYHRNGPPAGCHPLSFDGNSKALYTIPRIAKSILSHPYRGEHPVLRIEFDHEDDGRWIAEIPALPGVMAYGASQKEAQAKVEALALRALADRLEHGETVPELGELFVAA